MVVVDQLAKNGWCHLASPDLVLLHQFAASMRIKDRRFHRSKHGDIPHYDLKGEEREIALKYGALPVNSKTLVKYMLTSDRDVVFDFLDVKLEVFKEMFRDAFNKFKNGHYAMVPRMIPKGMTVSKAQAGFSSRPGDDDFVWRLEGGDEPELTLEELRDQGMTAAPFPYPFPRPSEDECRIVGPIPEFIRKSLIDSGIAIEDSHFITRDPRFIQVDKDSISEVNVTLPNGALVTIRYDPRKDRFPTSGGIRQPIQDKHRHPHNHSLEDLENLRDAEWKKMVAMEEAGKVPDFDDLPTPPKGAVFGTEWNVFREKSGGIELEEKVGRLLFDSIPLDHEEIEKAISEGMEIAIGDPELFVQPEITKPFVSVAYKCQRCGHDNNAWLDHRSMVTCEKCRHEESVEVNFEENE